MTRKSIREFIAENRADLEAAINRVLNPNRKPGWDHKLSISDIREWILNDEGLYRWARSEGVRI